MTGKVQQIPIEKLTKLQVRAAECQATKEAYAELYARTGEEEVQMPPLKVFKVGNDLLVADGNHRLPAAKLAGRGFLPCVIVGSGTLKDAQGFAIKCNHDHGLRQTNADKRAAVRIAHELGWFDDGDSVREVARLLHLSHTFVNKQRKQYEAELRRQGGNVSTPDPDEPTEESADTDREPDSDTEPAADEPQADEPQADEPQVDETPSNSSTAQPSSLERASDLAEITHTAAQLLKVVEKAHAEVMRISDGAFPNLEELATHALKAARVMSEEAAAAVKESGLRKAG